MTAVALTRDGSTGAGVGITWVLANGEDGEPWDTLDYRDVCVQVVGTFGVAGNVKIQGSNDVDPTIWADLNDPQGNALDIGSEKIEQILENPRWIRPYVSGGDEDTDLTILIWAGRTR